MVDLTSALAGSTGSTGSTGAAGSTGSDTAGPAAPEALRRALDATAELRKANPDWAKSLTRVDVLGEEDLRLHTKDLPFPLLVRRADLAAKIHRFEALLPELGRRYTALEIVDLRFARRIIVQPKPFTNGGAG